VKWRIVIAISVLAIWSLALNHIAHQKLLREKLIGSWTLASWQTSGNTGGESPRMTGEEPQGRLVIEASGVFAYMVVRRPDIQITSRDRAIAQTVSYFGTYTVSEAESTITLHIECSSSPDLNGTQQKRIITSLTADEMRYAAPAHAPDQIDHVVWKRAGQASRGARVSHGLEDGRPGIQVLSKDR
jgi:hypothetical protein